MGEIVYYYKNYDELFNQPDDESKNWYEKFYELSYAGNLEALNNLLSSAEEIYFDEYLIYNSIQQLTNDDMIEKRKRILKQIKISGIVRGIKKFKDGTIIIKTKKPYPNILVIKLSELIPETTHDGNLGNWERHGKCHDMSHSISLRLGIPNDLVTGYVRTVSDKTKFLHSWVEFSDGEKEYAIDYTMNVMMNKKGYYFLRKCEEICRINDTDVLFDLDIFSRFPGISTREYCVFRHEIVKEYRQESGLIYKKVK